MSEFISADTMIQATHIPSSCIPQRIVQLFALLACVFFAAGVASAQRRSEAQVRSYLTSGVVRLGDRTTLILSVENASSVEVRALPKVNGLVIGPLPAPSERHQFEFRGNRQVQSVTRTWAIPVQSNGVGEFVIPPIELSIDGGSVLTAELRLNIVADLRGEELGFLEFRPSSRKVVVGQPFSLELVFGFDTAIAEQTNYGNLALSWWGRLPGLLENETAPSPGARRLKLTLNDRDSIEVEQVDPPREIKGRKFVTLRLRRSYTPTRTGQIEFPASFFEFGSMVERRDFFRTERQKGETYFVRAPELKIEVVPLPDAGRPVDYSGAIGKFSASASAQPRDVDAGESIKWRVEWTGEGNLEFFTAPDPSRLDAFRDFRVYGRTEEKSFDRRVVIYDIAPLTSQVRAIPALPLSIYDPQEGRYSAVQTAPIEIRVRALEGVSALDGAEKRERFDEDLRDIVVRPGARGRPKPIGPVGVGALGLCVPIGWLALRAFARRRFDPDAPSERARRRARRELRKALGAAAGAREQLTAIHGFVGARTAQAPQAWEGRKLAEALPPSQRERARALEECVTALERAVWGGEGGALERSRIESAVDDALRGGL